MSAIALLILHFSKKPPTVLGSPDVNLLHRVGVSDHESNAWRRGYWSTVLSKFPISAAMLPLGPYHERSPKPKSRRKGQPRYVHTLSPKPHMRARTGCCRISRLRNLSEPATSKASLDHELVPVDTPTVLQTRRRGYVIRTSRGLKLRIHRIFDTGRHPVIVWLMTRGDDGVKIHGGRVRVRR